MIFWRWRSSDPQPEFEERVDGDQNADQDEQMLFHVDDHADAFTDIGVGPEIPFGPAADPFRREAVLAGDDAASEYMIVRGGESRFCVRHCLVDQLL